MRSKSKAAKVLDILFIIDAIAIIYYATTFPIDRFDVLSIVVMAVLIVALFAFAVFSFIAKANLRKKELLSYVPLRNIQIEKGKEVVLVQKQMKTLKLKILILLLLRNLKLMFYLVQKLMLL